MLFVALTAAFLLGVLTGLVFGHDYWAWRNNEDN